MAPAIMTLVRLAILGALLQGPLSPAAVAADKKRIFVVSSYHKNYLWSESTARGLVDAMLDYGYLDDHQQAAALAANDVVESSRAIIHRDWMDTKRKNSRRELALATNRIMGAIEAFRPDLVLLGDDNAANYIGNQLLDTETPVVFWGVNGLPLKYGLVESMDNPGHNVTGVWQAGYHRQSLEFLHRLIPEARTFAVLACDSETSRPNVKRLQALARAGKLPLALVDVVVTNDYAEFQARVLELAPRVDAFFMLDHDTFRDRNGEHVAMLEVGRWYLEHVRRPEAAHEDQLVHEGMLLTANDSGYNQSYRAFEMAYDILEQGLNPGRMRTVTPARGLLMVNRQRAEMLGIDLSARRELIEEVVETARALAE